MAWLACDKDGSECIYNNEPDRSGDYFMPHENDEDIYDDCIELPKGSIKKLIGRELKWEDEAVEL